MITSAPSLKGLGRQEDHQRAEKMRAAAAQAEEELKAAGKLEVEIEARAAIDERVQELIAARIPEAA